VEHILASDKVRVAVRPDLGGRIDSVIDLATGREWLWHPAWYNGERRQLDVGAAFDANWSGGWDEIFPNDAGCEFRGGDCRTTGSCGAGPGASRTQRSRA
jgi:hypothetical protein